MTDFGFHGPPQGICTQDMDIAGIQTDFDTGAYRQAQHTQIAGQLQAC